VGGRGEGANFKGEGGGLRGWGEGEGLRWGGREGGEGDFWVGVWVK